VVDDDDSIREALGGLIQSLGCRCLGFASAEDFLGFTGRSSIACVITDIKMTGLTGLELQDRLNAEGHPPPIIFMTSYADDATKAKAMDGGAFCFLGKPVDDDDLIACLSFALERY
jgi:FixJ family two-component response regulator